MPTLFMSYKRGTTAVAPLMEKLRNAHYRLWFDRDEIHLGDSDWQARIDRGLERCDGVLLSITPAACQSEPVRYEIKKARELGKPIFPIILDRIADYDVAIRELGLAEKQHLEDFTDVARWDEYIQRLVDALKKKKLFVTRHDLRQQRDRDNPKYFLHQTYLKRLAERIGMLNLAQINPENAQGVELERVYVDSPTGLNLSVETQDWQVVEWWISEGNQKFSLYVLDDDDKRDEPRRKPGELGYETAPFEHLINGIDEQIADYRQEHPDATPDEKYRWENHWNNGAKRNLINLHLKPLAAACDRLVILGAPGSGKSTFVKYLALCLAGSGIDDWTRDVDIISLDTWPHGALTPVYVELRHFVASRHFPAGVKTPATADHLWAYIEHELLGEGLRLYADDLRSDLEDGRALLILDGLDEVPYPKDGLKARQQQLIGLAQSLNTRYEHSRILVTSRPYAYAGWALPGFQDVTITKFEDAHRTELARRLYHAAGLDEATSVKQARALHWQLEQIDPELKDRPLFVTLMASIYLSREGEGLPTRRGALYRESILLLLDRWTQSKPGALSLIELLGDRSLDDLSARLAALAYEVHGQYGEQPGAPEIAESLLYEHLKPLGRTIAAELIPYLSENAGVLVSPGQDDDKDVFHFAHRTFQEYLAGAHMMGLCAEADSFQQVREHIMRKPQMWGVPCVLAGDVLADTDRRGDLWELLEDLLEELLNVDVEAGMSADDPRWWTVWLSSVIVQEQRLLENGRLRRSEKAIADPLREWLVALMHTVQALPPVERAACGRALSLLGDPRPGVGTVIVQIDGRKVELPQLEWCDIPAPPSGVFIMGTDDYEDNPRCEVELKYSFKMAKYPVTHQQFQTFVDSGDYNQPEWWASFPPEYQPQKMTQQHNPHLNHPRDNVSWYQAVAFTRWLDAKYREVALFPLIAEGEGLGAEMRLPTEQEWEYSARGTDERKYPYFGDFDPSKSNVFDSDIEQTSASGLFPEGASPFGVLDMSGNVSEWCLNHYPDPKVVDGHSDAERKVLRGGSFVSLEPLIIASARQVRYPINNTLTMGFRLVLSVPAESLVDPLYSLRNLLVSGYDSEDNLQQDDSQA